MKTLTPALKEKLAGWTRPQIKALLRLLRRFSGIGPAQLHHCGDYTGVTAGGMFIGIEKNGYTHT